MKLEKTKSYPGITFVSRDNTKNLNVTTVYMQVSLFL